MAKNLKGSDRRMSSRSREDQEKSEALVTERVAAPSERFQDEQQVNPAITAEKTSTPDSSFIPKSSGYKGSTIKQEVAAKAILDGKAAGTSGLTSAGAVGLRSIEFSGDTGTILGNVSGTPTLDRSAQGGTRVEKRLSDANKDINYLASEQVLVEYDNVPPLADSDSTVGYNGNPKNVAARSQKKTGATSAEILYDRSVDIIAKDEFVFTTGQVVKSTDSDYDDGAYPTTTYEQVTSGSTTGWQQQEFSRVRGNYAPRYIEIQLTKAEDEPAYVSSFQVIEDDFSVNGARPEVVNRSATNHYIDLNAAEVSRQTIDQTAGSPNDANFNPLGRSVDQPSRTVMYLRDMESTVGATIFAAYKFAQKARGYYLNRTAKDGQDLIAPALDALYGNILPASASDDIVNIISGRVANNPGLFFDREGMQYGSAAIMPMIFDSASKYQTKADLVTQPKGLRLALQTADNNMNPFRVKPEFVKALNSCDVFSTIDRGYDPMSAVAVTDNVRLVYPYSWAQTLQFTRSGYNQPRTYQSKVFRYKYGAGSGNNTYYITVGDPLLNGIAYFAELHAARIYQALAGRTDTTVTWRIPVVHSTMHFGLWDQLVCAATPYILYERTNSMKDILDYEQWFKYPFVEFISIKDANPMAAVNYANPSALQPIQSKQMLPSSACRWTMPELFFQIGEDDVMLPFYFSEDQINLTGSNSTPTFEVCDPDNFSTPVTRAGLRLAYADDFYGMSVKDQLLCRDILTKIPGYLDDATIPGYVYKYSQDSEGLLVLKAPAAGTVSPAVVHSTPRQLGWIMDAYAGECNVIRLGSESTDSKVFGLLEVRDDVNITDVGPSFRIIAYRGPDHSQYDVAARQHILGPGAVNVSRAQAFSQIWVMRRASSKINRGSDDFDIDVSMYDGFDAIAAGGNNIDLNLEHTTFQPYTFANYTGVTTGVSPTSTNIYTGGPYLFSLHRVLWAMLQKLPFVINPFDAVPSNDDGVGTVDPFGYAYLFNLAGFMSASYHEEIYNRLTQRMNQGYGYLSDPMVVKIGRAHV